MDRHRTEAMSGRGASRWRRALLLVAATLVLVAGLDGCGGDGGSAGSGPVRSTTPATTTEATSSVPRSTPPTASTPSTTTPTTSVGCTTEAALAHIGTWPLRRRLAQLLFVGIDPGDPSEAHDLAASPEVGGIFIGGNSTAALQGNGLKGLATAHGIPVLVAVDEEGGRVQRIDALDGSWPSAREVARTKTPSEAEALARAKGEALRRHGVTMDFAPSVDVSDQPDGAVIGDRSYANDPKTVTTYARATSQGLQAAGVIPVLKHFPGHGHAQGDSHGGAAVTPSLSQLEAVDLVPYRELLAGAPAVMVGHLEVPGLTKGMPASLSPEAVDGLLRRDLGYDGLVVTDEIGGMKAVSDRYGLGEASARAIAAGVDMVLWNGPSRVPAALAGLRSAVSSGRLPESRVDAAVRHVLIAKHVDPCAA